MASGKKYLLIVLGCLYTFLSFVLACQSNVSHSANPITADAAVVISQTKWTLDTIHLATIRDERIFVANLHGKFIKAFNPYTGDTVWETDEANMLRSTAMVGDESKLYVVTGRGLTAINQETGSILWQKHLPVEGEFQDLLVMQEERLVVYADVEPFAREQTIYALDARTGKVKWQVKITGSLDWHKPDPGLQTRQRHSAIRYDKGRVYLRTIWKDAVFSSIVALDANDGTALWHFDFGIKQMPGDAPSFAADTLLLTDTSVYIPIFLGPLYVVDSATGTLIGMRDEWRISPVLIQDEIVTYVSGVGAVALDDQSFQELWFHSLDEEIIGIPEIVAWDDYIVVEDFPTIKIFEADLGKQVGSIIADTVGKSEEALTIGQCDLHLCLITSNSVYVFAVAKNESEND